MKVKPRAKAAATKGKGKCRVPVKTSGLVDCEKDEEAMEVDAVESEEEEPRQKQAWVAASKPAQLGFFCCIIFVLDSKSKHVDYNQ